MALANVLNLSQIAGYVIIAILSLCIFIPMSIQLHEFNGHCLLFANGTWREEDGLFDVQWPSTGFCKFPIGTGVFLFFVSLPQIYWFSRLTYKQNETTFFGLFLDVVIGISSSITSIISAIIITFGFIEWCSAMTQRFPSCEIASGQNIFKENVINTSGFYLKMGTAQFGAWGCFAMSVGVAVISLLKLINNHVIYNIRVSMYLERQRLVNEDTLQNQAGRISPTN